MTQPTPIPIFEEQEDFYVPYFEIKVENNPLPEAAVRDVIKVTYKDNVDEIDSFELTINNWDAEQRKPRFEPPVDDRYQGIFDPGKKLELWMGYRGNLRLMLKGEITTLEPSFPESGGPTLAVRGQNELFSLRKKQHTWSWGTDSQPVRDSDIAEEIGRNPVSDRRPGLGMRVITDPAAKQQEAPEPFVFMNNQYDILFLTQRARRHGYTMWIELDAQSRANVLHFGPSDRLRDVTYELEWGKSLVNFRPTLTTARQVSQVTVRGWNRRTGRPIEATAKWGDPGLEINRDQQAVAQAVQARHEVIVDHPIHSPQEARDLARNTLRNLLKDMIKADATTVGLPDLRAGRQVHILRLGPRFSGVYFVTETTHTIGEDGYRTTFKARREDSLADRRKEQVL